MNLERRSRNIFHGKVIDLHIRKGIYGHKRSYFIIKNRFHRRSEDNLFPEFYYNLNKLNIKPEQFVVVYAHRRKSSKYNNLLYRKALSVEVV